MATDLFQMFDNTYNDFNPELLEKYKNMKIQIKNQKDENTSLLKELDFLNQEIKSIFENIIKTNHTVHLRSTTSTTTTLSPLRRSSLTRRQKNTTVYPKTRQQHPPPHPKKLCQYAERGN